VTQTAFAIRLPYNCITLGHRTTVTFSDQAWQTITDISDESGISMAEVIRRALSMYRWYRNVRSMGQHVLIERNGAYREVMGFA